MSKFRVVVCGMGGRGVSTTKFLLENMPQVEIAGLVDKIPERHKPVLKYLGIDVPCFTDTKKCLDTLHPNAIIVMTTDFAHIEPVVTAMQRDIHVYCEKPMAISLEGCDKIIEAAKKSKAIFYMGFNMRHNPFYSIAHEIVASGEIGDLLTINSTEFYYGGRTFFRRWNRFKKYGGGLWITKATHDFDMLNWFAAAEPVRVYAIGGLSMFKPKQGAGARCSECALASECPDYTPLETDGSIESLRIELREISKKQGYLPLDACLYQTEKDTIDHGIATINFSNGVCATHVLNVVTSPQVSRRELTIHGTKGVLLKNNYTGNVELSFRASKASRTYDTKSMSIGGHGGSDPKIYSDFIQCCKEGKTPKAGWKDGRLAVEVGLAATKSQEEGVLVDLPLERD